MWVGTDDRRFRWRQVRDEPRVPQRRQDYVELTEIPGHTHDYYGRSSDINKAAWLFLKEKRLDKDPQYQHYLSRADAAAAA